MIEVSKVQVETSNLPDLPVSGECKLAQGEKVNYYSAFSMRKGTTIKCIIFRVAN